MINIRENKSSKILLFGSGEVGKQALDFFGSDFILGFVDSNESLSHKEKYGKRILSIRELKEIGNYILIISANMKNSREISILLEENGIYDYLVYGELGQSILKNTSAKTFLEKYSDVQMRFRLQKESYQNKIKKMEEQLRLIEEYVTGKHLVVEFYLVDAFEISHFLPFYYYFQSRGVYVKFVAEPTESNTVGNWFDCNNAIEILKKEGIYYSERLNPNSDFVFSTQAAHVLKKYSSKTKKINLAYGCSLNKNAYWYAKEGMDDFDYKFVHGRFAKQICKSYMNEEKIKVIGYPRYYNSIKHDRETICGELGIYTRKPILCYLPTWDQDSSIQEFFDELKRLKEHFFIVTKPHHCTYRLKEKKCDLDRIHELSDIVLNPAFDLGKVSFLGDLTLCDAKSGAALEVGFLNPKAKMIWMSVRKNMEEYFYKEAFDLAKIINKPAELLSSVEEVIKDDEFIKKRKEQMELFFGRKDIEYFQSVYDEVFGLIKGKI